MKVRCDLTWTERIKLPKELPKRKTGFDTQRYSTPGLAGPSCRSSAGLNTSYTTVIGL